MTAFRFDILDRDGEARRGCITTPRGDIRTPAFMPVGTAATVKALYPQQVREAGADIILGNTYHLMLRPGAERVHRLGGLHDFMRWDGPILTDSGGFQVMSLSGLRKVTEEGVAFQSHVDGSRHMLTPERSIDIQCLLGADIQMQFDECVALPAEHARVEAAMELSLRWAERCLAPFEANLERGLAKPGQALFAIVQGGVEPDLRRRSAEALAAGLGLAYGADIEGDVAEFGTMTGYSAVALARAIRLSEAAMANAMAIYKSAPRSPSFASSCRASFRKTRSKPLSPALSTNMKPLA